MHTEPLSWLLWHPHQGLWNWRLVDFIRHACSGWRRRMIVGLVIALDTLVLAARVIARRLRTIGLRHLTSVPRVPSLVYFDVGTHRKAAELDLMVRHILPRLADRFLAYGFEAVQEYAQDARRRFAHEPRVQIVHAAVYSTSGTVAIQRSGNDGLGASLYRPGAVVEHVPAVPLSQWCEQRRIDLGRTICLLRMNIEGAEMDVIQDLAAHDLLGSIDGYYGMWDDAAKIDPARGLAFQGLLEHHGISPCTFNGRDFCFAPRLRLIEYDVQTSLLAGARRVG
jgi:FkbM family methyltransferase